MTAGMNKMPKKKFWSNMNINETFKRIISSIILLPIVIFSIIKGSYFFNSLIFLCFLISSYEWLKMNNNFFYKIFNFLYS